MKIKILLALIGLALFSFFTVLQSQRISTTKHNLSTSGPGSVKSTTEGEICVFCHIPHASARTPLWNRTNSAATYSLYTSTTLNATMGQPDGSSINCLSCHDGTIALGHVTSRTSDISFGSTTTMPATRTNLGTDLRDDHPISFAYTAALATADGKLNNPTSLGSGVKLDANGKMQCTSCHDPHYSSNTKFLVATNQYSTLCIVCHNDANWASSTHKTSTATWNSTGTNPWLHTSYTTTQQNACESCHNTHQAGGTKRLLNYSAEESNCLYCHNGNVASSTKNINSELSKTYKHNVAGYSAVHDPTEGNEPTTKHVECVDCHNPHASNAATASAPAVKGNSQKVKGINSAGSSVNPVTYEYEICLRCHSSVSWRQTARTIRIIEQSNVRLEFNTGNPSHHAVFGAGPSSDVPSLVTGYSTTSVIYCTDCHSSDGTNVPKGPHGSTVRGLLKSGYATADNTTESATAYALCYSCHSRTSILNDVTFKEHSKHIVSEKAPCNACHDPHGISSTQGNATNNSRLINFDTTIVRRSGSNRYFRDDGYRTGTCYLTCHSTNHNGWNY